MLRRPVRGESDGHRPFELKLEFNSSCSRLNKQSFNCQPSHVTLQLTPPKRIQSKVDFKGFKVLSRKAYIVGVEFRSRGVNFKQIWIISSVKWVLTRIICAHTKKPRMKKRFLKFAQAYSFRGSYNIVPRTL